MESTNTTAQYIQNKIGELKAELAKIDSTCQLPEYNALKSAIDDYLWKLEAVRVESTVWQAVDLETDKVFFTTRDSQAGRWNNDERYEVTPSPSRRPVVGYSTWMMDSPTDKWSLKLGLEA